MMTILFRVLFLLMLCAGAPAVPAQTGTLAPPDNLIVEGVPHIPASIIEKSGRYNDARTATLSSWHPVRREMLIGTRFGDATQVHLLKFPGAARTQVTFFPETVRGAQFQPKKGNHFIFAKDIGGNEFYQIYRYDLATGDVVMLTDGTSRNTGAVWSNAGDRIVYGSTRRTKKDVDLYIADPLDPSRTRMLAQLEGGGWSAVDWSPDDRKILVISYVSANESYLWLFDAASGEKTLLTPQAAGAEKIAYGGARFSRDGNGIYATTDRGSEFERLAYIDLATKEHTVLTDHIKWNVEEFELSPDGKILAFVTNEDGLSRFRLLDTRSRREMPLPQPLPAGQVSGIEWHESGREIGFNLSSARSPSDVYSLDVKTGRIDRWTMSETGGLNTENFSEPELIRWKSFDDRAISGFLYRPPARFTGRRPVIIQIHGGPEGQARPGFLGRSNYYLNELGIAIIYPNVRGSAGYGKTFLKLDNGFLRADSYKDIGALLDYIKKDSRLDADRVMVSGGSYGGHMSFAVAALYSDRMRAALPVVGISNLVTFLERTEGYRRDLRRVEYGDERDPKMREYLEKIAPLNNATKIKIPMFIVQGGNDPRVPRTESEQMVAKIRSNGTPVWFLLAKDEGHGFAKKKNQDFQFYATVMFIERYLLGRNESSGVAAPSASSSSSATP